MTAQIAESLIYEGKQVRMCSTPLSDYFAFGGKRPNFDTWYCTALWRGYTGERPFLIYFAIKEHLYPTQPYVEKVFQVDNEHLGKPVEVSSVEATEKVFDPLGAVPDIPFGHLNAAWRKFKDQMGDGDRLWTFSAEWESDWGRPELRDGYVVVKPDASVGTFFMTSWIILDKPKSQQKEKRRWD